MSHQIKYLFILMICTVLLSAAGTSHVVAEDNNDCQEDCEAGTYGIPASEIEAYPEPAVEGLTVDQALIHDRWYLQVDGALSIFDAPNGNHIGTLDAGFNFVTALQEQDDWIMINPDQWVKKDKLRNSNGIVSNFTGVMLPENGLPYTMAWALVNMYPSSEPGGDPVESNGLVYRYTRLNIYDSVIMDGFEWFQIGVNKWVHQYHVARILPVERPEDVETDLWISIDLYEQVLIAYEGVQPVFATLISSGMAFWPTREGLYNIYFRRLRKNMSGGQVGDDYYFLEEVPWTMFFDEGRALHGAYWHDGFGYRRSHGCVNLSITDAHWLYQWVADEMDSLYSADKEDGPAVYVYSSGEYE